jgi:hypothetical protein
MGLAPGHFQVRLAQKLLNHPNKFSESPTMALAAALCKPFSQ